MSRETATDGILLGFDARDVSQETSQLVWSQPRRERWLFRPEVLRVRSVDSRSWPSVIDHQRYLDKRAWIGFVDDLWDKLDEMTEFLAVHPPPSAYEVVAVTLIHSVLPRADQHLWNKVIESTDPSTLSTNWLSLGYDVADRYLLGGLVSCIPNTHPEFSRIKNNYKSALNDNHLFDSLTDANKFREEFNTVVFDHAPFFVFQLHTQAAAPMDPKI